MVIKWLMNLITSEVSQNYIMWFTMCIKPGGVAVRYMLFGVVLPVSPPEGGDKPQHHNKRCNKMLIASC